MPISSDTKREYDASRELRSGRHDKETVTLLYRLANHMEQPYSSVPKFDKPLKLPFLAHSPFKTNLQKFLTNLIRRHRHVLIPYRLPTKTVQEMPHPSLSKVLWNHKRKVTDLGRSWKHQECQCQQFAKKHLRATRIACTEFFRSFCFIWLGVPSAP